MRHRPRMRPTFEIPLQRGPDAFFESLAAALRAGGSPYVGQVLPGHAIVHLPPTGRTILSPFLSLDWDPDSGVVRGRFSPHPNVWTGFIATYVLLGLGGLAGTMYGLSELMLDNVHWSLAAAPVALALIAFIYGAAVIGQGLTIDDMYALRQFVEKGIAPPHEEPGSR